MKLLIYFLFIFEILSSQVINSYKFNLLENTQTSNSITDILIKGDSILLGTGKGLSISPNKGANWKNYFNSSEFGMEDISAITFYKNNILVATAHSEQKDNSYLPVGSGIKISKNGGNTWEIIPQPIDKNNIDTLIYGNNKIRSIGVTTNVYNLCYDIASKDSLILIASFAGMLRKSVDYGLTWNKVILPPDNLNSIKPSDSLKFDLSPTSGSLGLAGNLNHRIFSVIIDKENIIWVGTANGINKSVDGGISWTKFNFLNQTESISGNFVVALYCQYFKDKKYIWASTINAENQNEKRGVSFSSDNGQTWQRTLIGEFAHNFSSQDSIIYVATDNGIFRSNNFGKTWIQSGSIFDKNNFAKYTTNKFYAVAVQKSNIWAGGNDGLIMTTDSIGNSFGMNWNIFRASNVDTKKSVYAYPNPFAPGLEVVRIKYNLTEPTKITIRIFDFGMNLIKTVVQNYQRDSNQNFYEEIWDGRDETNNYVVNGTYFYKIEFGNNSSDWGKILVIR